ncbi:choice-of-anchor L domain-containing protein [Aquimarina gracilis]|uniref:Choice-of-anchor L domain-containing protein n=1 Tax=Aquimarina gracilis TaxID=874422 RepID=A0ABU6A2C0_9FLAO|nr:choice-of-anchor L domain-containing protein [Aquimarina gracilis]MEB3348231.1 choice-of-anchor L domain-containing protein [Aquimarina gracilis]
MLKKSIFTLLILLTGYITFSQESLLVNPAGNPFTNLSAGELVRDILITDDDIIFDPASIIVIENPDGTGDPRTRSWGYFNKGQSEFPFDEGIILTTGKAIDARGPNNQEQTATGELNWVGDNDLKTILDASNEDNFDTYNATAFQFEFTPQGSTLIFDFIFASEEYEREFECITNVRDGFAFLIKGPGIPNDSGTTFGGRNIAAIPGSNNIAVNTGSIHINTDDTGMLYRCGTEELGINFFPELYISNSAPGTTNPIMQYDGYTTVLNTETTVIPGETYTIKFVITDRGDPDLDSAVFIRGFTIKSNVVIVDESGSDLDFVLCENDSEILTAQNVDDPFSGAETYEWQLNGVTIPQETSSSITISQSGTYRVIVTDMGDTLEDTITVTNPLCGCGGSISPPTNPSNVSICLGDPVPELSVDVPNGQSANWYDQNGTLLLANSTTFTSREITAGNYIYNVEAVDTNGNCTSDPIQVLFNIISLPEVSFQGEDAICVDSSGQPIDTGDTIVLDTLLDEREFSFIWFLNGTEVPDETSSSFIATQPGEYSVSYTHNTSNCSDTSSVIIKSVMIPVDLTLSLTQGAFSQNNGIVAIVTGNGNYEYVLDNGEPQESNVFMNVGLGLHEVTVFDRNGCGSITKEIFVIGFPEYFTPNGDGFHDQWNVIKNINTPEMKIFIFDRFGKLLKQINPNGSGWDGTYNGKLLPSTSYWFKAEFLDGSQTYKGHFALIR